jgi:hypothetical protein
MKSSPLALQACLSLTQGLFLTPILLIFIPKYSLFPISCWFVPLTIVENALFCYAVQFLLKRRWWCKVIAGLSILVHSSIVGMDTAALFVLRQTLDGGLLIYGTTNMQKGANQVDSNTKYILMFMMGSFLIELLVLCGTRTALCHFARDSKYEFLLQTKDAEIKTQPNRSRLHKLLPLAIFLLYSLVGSCTTIYSPFTNFIKALLSFYSLTCSSAVFKGSLGNCDNSFPKSFKVSDKKKKANLVMILNESLGNHVWKTDEAREECTFYRDMVRGNKSVFYDFTNTRTNGGSTDSAAPASLAGYIMAHPVTSSQTDLFYTAPTLACMAKQLNYTTAVYSAQPTQNENGWRQLNGIFDHFDSQVSPSTLTDGTEVYVNDLGMDDRILTDKIIKYIETLSTEQPFFLLIFWNNNHSPFEVDKDFKPEGTDREQRFQRAVHSAAMTDKMTRQVYEALEKKGFAEDTVMGFLSDHGESAPDKSTRIGYPDSRYLGAPMWLRAPEYLLEESEKKVLRENEDKLTATLDLVPTLTHILGWATPDYLFDVDIPSSMIHGQSLLSPISHNRIVPAWQGQPFVRPCNQNFGIFSNATHNVIIKADRSTIDIEEVDDRYHTRAIKKLTWEDMSHSDQKFWKEHLESYPPMHKTLMNCGFVMPPE